MIAASPLSGCPLAKPATQHLRWPSEGKGTTIGRQSGSSCVNGVSPWCTEPPVTKAHHRNDTNPPRNVKGSYPLPPNPPRPSGVTNVGPTTAIDTHNLAGTIVPKRVAPPLTPAVYQVPDTATVWTCPTPVDTHTARRFTNNTQSQGHRAVCALRRPTCPQSNDIAAPPLSGVSPCQTSNANFAMTQ